MCVLLGRTLWVLPYPYNQKNNRVRTVVNKLHQINAQFRFFDMELIAGEPEYVVEHVSANTAALKLKLTPAN